jgi:hypothetical protein
MIESGTQPLLRKVDGPAGLTVQYSYDNKGRLILAQRMGLGGWKEAYEGTVLKRKDN